MTLHSDVRPDRNQQFAALTGVVCAVLFSTFLPYLPLPEQPFPPDPFYSPRPTRTCPTPSVVDYSVPVTRPCIHVTVTTATTFAATLRLPNPHRNTAPTSITVHLIPRLSPTTSVGTASLRNITHTTPLTYRATHLTAATDYSLDVHASFATHPRTQHLCTSDITTASNSANILQNPSFEQEAQSPFAATRSSSPHGNPRQWTPFYNGGARRVCTVFPALFVRQGGVIAPRSGNCLLALARCSRTEWHLPPTSRHFGAHQAIPLPDITEDVAISLWYIHRPRAPPPPPHENNQPPSSASLVIGWTFANGQLADGVTVPLAAADTWTPICIVLHPGDNTMLRMLHIFIHNDDDETATAAHSTDSNTTQDAILLVDDAAVWLPATDSGVDLSHCHSIHASGTPLASRSAPVVHLRATQRSPRKSLTAAVPLTADRILRLETLSRQFGGGSISAAVAVGSASELRIFAAVWRSKAWLRRHVDVTFVRRYRIGGGQAGMRGSPLGINALRNIAVHLASTEFVIMLDVDMTPAPLSFDCLREDGGNVLSTVLPPGGRRLIAMGVFMTDVHQRAATDKGEQTHMLVHHAGTAYCASSQRATRLKTWIRGYGIRRTRFQSDYEPYALGRRDDYPGYDERFSGYGFNKISWLLKAEAEGWAIMASGEWFVTHLNHVENEWVSGIDERGYLQTWRRYLALGAEVGDVRAARVGGVRVIEDGR